MGPEALHPPDFVSCVVDGSAGDFYSVIRNGTQMAYPDPKGCLGGRRQTRRSCVLRLHHSFDFSFDFCAMMSSARPIISPVAPVISTIAVPLASAGIHAWFPSDRFAKGQGSVLLALSSDFAEFLDGTLYYHSCRQTCFASRFPHGNDCLLVKGGRTLNAYMCKVCILEGLGCDQGRRDARFLA